MSDLERVFARMSEKLSGLGAVVCAGGAVRDHLLGKPAKDYDLFLLGRTLDAALADSIKARLAPLEEVRPLEWHKSEPYLVSTVRDEGFEVQVMVNPARTLGDLLDTFDWNVCLFGYDGRVIAREPVENIAPGHEMRLQRVTFPLSTLRRGFRFSERFKMKMRREDILDLCGRVLALRANTGPNGAEPDQPALAANVLSEEVRP